MRPITGNRFQSFRQTAPAMATMPVEIIVTTSAISLSGGGGLPINRAAAPSDSPRQNDSQPCDYENLRSPGQGAPTSLCPQLRQRERHEALRVINLPRLRGVKQEFDPVDLRRRADRSRHHPATPTSDPGCAWRDHTDHPSRPENSCLRRHRLGIRSRMTALGRAPVSLPGPADPVAA